VDKLEQIREDGYRDEASNDAALATGELWELGEVAQEAEAEAEDALDEAVSQADGHPGRDERVDEMQRAYDAAMTEVERTVDAYEAAWQEAYDKALAKRRKEGRA
jgi:CHASE3 domain sensor protein